MVYFTVFFSIFLLFSRRRVLRETPPSRRSSSVRCHSRYTNSDLHTENRIIWILLFRLGNPAASPKVTWRSISLRCRFPTELMRVWDVSTLPFVWSHIYLQRVTQMFSQWAVWTRWSGNIRCESLRNLQRDHCVSCWYGNVFSFSIKIE